MASLFLNRRTWFALALGLFGALLAPAGAAPAVVASEPAPIVWSQFQGGPGHPGAAEEGPAPAFEKAWSFEESDDAGTMSGVVVEADTAIAVGAHRVFGIDVATGTERWTLIRSGGPISMPAVGDVQDKRILAFTDRAPDGTTSLVAWDIAAEPRLEVWRQPLETGSHSGVTIDGDNVFVADDQGRVYGFDLLKGVPLWEPVGGVGRIDAPPAAGEGRVYAVARDTSNGAAEVFGVDVATGKKVWTFRPRVRGLTISAPALVDGVLYVAAPDQLVHALGAEKGNTLDTFRLVTGVWPLSAPAVSGGAVFVGDVNGGVYAYALTSGERLWDYQLNEPQLRSSPVVVGNIVVIGLNDGRVVAIDVESGHLVWQSDLGPAPVGPIAVAGDRLVAATAGADGGLIGLAHDPSGTLTDVPSPSELHLGTTLANFGIAALGAFVVIFGAMKLLTLRFPLEPVGMGKDEGEDDDEEQDETWDEEEDG